MRELFPRDAAEMEADAPGARVRAMFEQIVSVNHIRNGIIVIILCIEVVLFRLASELMEHRIN